MLGLPGPLRQDLVPAAGDPAELLLLPGRDLTDALAGAGEARTVVHAGRVVATTSVSRQLGPPA